MNMKKTDELGDVYYGKFENGQQENNKIKQKKLKTTQKIFDKSLWKIIYTCT